jgi:hypothetical protein
MPRPKEDTIWNGLSDDEYARVQAKSWAKKTHSSELTPAELADFRDHYPLQFDAAEGMLALQDDAALVSTLKPVQRAAMKRLCPDLLAEYEDAQVKVLTPMLAEPWRFKQYAELRPTERASYARAKPAEYAAARAAHLGAR